MGYDNYTVNGKNILWKGLSELGKGGKVHIDLNDLNLSGLLGTLVALSSAESISILYNIDSDEEARLISGDTSTLRQKDKLNLLSRTFKSSVSRIGLTSNIYFGLKQLERRIDEDTIKVYLCIDSNKHGQLGFIDGSDHGITVIQSNRVEVLPSESLGLSTIPTDTITSDEDQSQETISVMKYPPNTKRLGTLVTLLTTKEGCAGRNLAKDLNGILLSMLDFDSSVESLYYKSLYEINKHHINSSATQQRMLNTMDKAELKFQSDGVDSLINILLKYNIAYLADSVGLGKTVTTLRLLAKTRYSALIVAPSQLVLNQWKDYINEPNGLLDESVSIHFCLNSYQDLAKFTALDKDYDIVIFDEAHNFRNMNTLRYEKAQEICAGKRVLLVGATPVNNGITDIEAQLMLGLSPSECYDFGVGRVGNYFNNLRKMTNKDKRNIQEYKAAQKKAGLMVRGSIISKLMVRRTRADINKYYKQDIDSGNLHFPKVNDPVIMRYQYSGNKLSKTLDILSGLDPENELVYALYNPSRYVLASAGTMDGKRKSGKVVPGEIGDPSSGNIVVPSDPSSVDSLDTYIIPEVVEEGLREINMTGLTKVRLIKMLDSSIVAFINSLQRMIDSIENQINLLEGYITPKQYKESSLFELDTDQESETSNFLTDTYRLKKFSPQFLIDLHRDQDILRGIVALWSTKSRFTLDQPSTDTSIDPDADVKISELRKIIDNNPGRKMVVFTEFIDTAESVSSRLTDFGYRVLKIDGSDSKSKSRQLLDNFSLSGRLCNDYDILVSTNVLSEGINLNRASIAVNYDITWNPMVITQRVGRLNRIDSKETVIDVYNFFPSDEMDTAILSESNIISKYALASYSIGTDENYLSTDSGDSAESMMEYKYSIVSNISTAIKDEQLDFRTVDFRYAAEAERLFNRDTGACRSIPSKSSVMLSKIKSDDSIVPGYIGIYKFNGRLIVERLGSKGYDFPEYNDFLDILSSHRDSELLDLTPEDFDTISDLYDLVQRIVVPNVVLDKQSNDLYTVVSRLGQNLEESIDKQEISEIAANKLIIRLNNVKRNIRSGLLREYLCGVYNKRFVKWLQGMNDQDDTESQFCLCLEADTGLDGTSTAEAQVNYLLNTVIPKRFTRSNQEYNMGTSIQTIGVLCVV